MTPEQLQIVLDSMDDARRMAHRIWGVFGLPSRFLDDLIAEGFYGLCKAALGYPGITRQDVIFRSWWHMKRTAHQMKDGTRTFTNQEGFEDIPDPSSEEREMTEENRDTINILLGYLTPKQRRVVELRLGINSPQLSLEETASEIGLCGNYGANAVSQVYRDAILKMKRNYNASNRQ